MPFCEYTTPDIELSNGDIVGAVMPCAFTLKKVSEGNADHNNEYDEIHDLDIDYVTIRISADDGDVEYTDELSGFAALVGEKGMAKVYEGLYSEIRDMGLRGEF